MHVHEDQEHSYAAVALQRHKLHLLLSKQQVCMAARCNSPGFLLLLFLLWLLLHNNRARDRHTPNNATTV